MYGSFAKLSQDWLKSFIFANAHFRSQFQAPSIIQYYYEMASNVAFKAMLLRCGMDAATSTIFMNVTGMEDAESILTLTYKEYKDAIKYAGKAAIAENLIISTVVRKKIANVYPFLTWTRYRGEAALIPVYDAAAITDHIG